MDLKDVVSTNININELLSRTIFILYINIVTCSDDQWIVNEMGAINRKYRVIMPSLMKTYKQECTPKMEF